MLTVAHNMAAMNSQRQLNTNTKARMKVTEKLSSGYKINRAADDAAGLSISEKMRQLIRGLDQGTENAQDGVSWTQIGDGALHEAHSILQRMNELSVQALNGTNSREDREAIQAEFDQLQTELDRISATTEFNELGIFHEHKSTYYQCEGSVEWDPKQSHSVYIPKNDLVISYRKDKNAMPSQVRIEIPEGSYTTQELADEIDTALENAGVLDDGIMFELSDKGFYNVNYEGGEFIDSVSGALSYLLYDTHEGGEFGALIGTTSFASGYPLNINSENNHLSFVIQDMQGNTVTTKSITIQPSGRYTKEELIDYLNNALADTSVKASSYGDGIKLSSEDAIVTKFKGNMFKLDFGNNVNTSVFYDNVAYGKAELTAGVFQGGAVLTTSSKDEEYKVFRIDSNNNKLSIRTNDMADAVEIEIDPGEYTISQMEAKLDSLFDDANLGVDVSYQNVGGYYRLTITTDEEGVGKEIEIDSNSSAYGTLFTDRQYTLYSTSASIRNENNTDTTASFQGSKDLSGISAAKPLTITQGSNDKFNLVVNGNSNYEITLSAKDYDSAQAIADEINAQLTAQNVTGVTAEISGNTLRFTTDMAEKITSVEAKAVTGNGGFDAIIQGYSIRYQTSTNSSSSGTITLGKYDGTIDTTDNPLRVNVGGKNYDVTLPTGNPTQDEIIAAIESQIQEKEVVTPNTFRDAAGQGKTTDRNYNLITAKGSTNTPSYSYSEKGVTETKEGTTEPIIDNPATMTIRDITIPSSFTVTDENRTIQLTINGDTQTYTLDKGNYTQDSFKKALQGLIDAKYGTTDNGAIVSISGGKLVLTARISGKKPGSETSLSIHTGNSSLLNSFATTKTAASITTSYALASKFTLTDSNNVFSFSYNGNQVSVTLDAKEYTRDSFIQALNEKLKDTGVVASKNNSNQLVLTTKGKGREYTVGYGTKSGGSSSSVIFGELTTKTTAKALVNLDTLDTIEITDTTKGFTIRVNGTDKSFDLTEGTYNRDEFVTMLNQRLTEENIGVRAYRDGNKIGLESLEAGQEQSFLMNYANGGSSMKQIYGETTTRYPGVDASFDANGNLVLSTDAGTSISVTSDKGGGFQTSTEIKTALNNSKTNGYYSNAHGTIDGANLSEPIEVDEYANNLSFKFTKDGVAQTITIEVPQQSYSYSELETKLQELLDAQTTANGGAAGDLTVSVNSSGVVIQTAGTGKNNRLESPSGDFYEKIMCKSEEKNEAQKVSNKAGNQSVDNAFIVGRQDVVTNGVNIRTGVSDVLSLDLTYAGVTHNLEMTLDAGEYSAQEIKNHIQSKLNEALKAEGLEENLIKVGVGDVSTGVVGANDSRAINFKINDNVAVPKEGDYIIDGVGGSAAFEVFYSTDGKLIPAYIAGTKDVTEGVTIRENEGDLSILVDGTAYDISLDAKEYTKDEILQVVNDKLKEVNAPVLMEEEDNHFKFSYVSLGKHTISVEGNAKADLFFQENGETGPAIGVNIQLSSEVGDFIEIPRAEFSTNLLNMNTVCLTEEKYATKALERVGKAINLVSALRSTFGSVQNRLEHAIANNENTHENTVAAESRIRDTDMSEAMVETAKLNILQQAGEAVLAQANSNQASIINLLQS